MSKIIRILSNASAIVFKKRPYRILGALSFVLFFTLYAFLLPATYTGGRVGLVSLQFLNFKLGAFAFIFSVMLALIVPFALYAFRKQAGRNSSAAAGSFAGSVLPPLLCCSPFLPSVAALAGGFSPVAFRVFGFLQGVIATYETYIYLFIAAILAYSAYLNAKRVLSANEGVCET